MAGRGAPAGNSYAAKGTLWARTLKRALHRFEANGIAPGEALGKIAEKVIGLALIGDKDAVAEIANRLDGKPAQSVEVNKTIHHVHTRESLTSELARLHARLAGARERSGTAADSGTASGAGSTH